MYISPIPFADRKTDADGHKQTGSSHCVEGVRFYSWRVCINQYESRTEDQRIRMRHYFRTGDTYRISVDGQQLPTKFRYAKTAVCAALAEMERKAKS